MAAKDRISGEIHCPDCGSIFNGVIDPDYKPRSIEQHNRYFKMLALVFQNWPEDNEEQFGSVTEMRKWLQMKAGHYKIASKIPIVGVSRETALMLCTASIRAVGEYAVPRAQGRYIVIYQPKSIAFHKLRHLPFCHLNNAVDEIIRQQSGLDPEKLLADAWAAKLLREGPPDTAPVVWDT